MCYFSTALKPSVLKKRVKIFSEVLKSVNIEPSYVLGRGISGAIALPTFANVLKCKIAVSRKAEDSSHAGSDRIEASDVYDFKDSKNVVIVDDFISSGSTIMKIREHMKSMDNPSAILLYCPSSYNMIDGYLINESDWKHVPIIGISEYGKEIYVKNIKLPEESYSGFTVRYEE